MVVHTRFGPAGVPVRFKAFIENISDVPNLLHAEDLDAFEYPAVRWGQKPQIRKESAELLGIRAQENDVILSVHGSYYINLCGKKEIVDASKRRIIACAQAAQWMNAYVLVFHPGFYGKMEKDAALKKCIMELENVVESMRSLGITKVMLGPETMGKSSQVGSLEEIITICETVKQTHLVIDWGHLHARGKGTFKKETDFRSILNTIEQRLGTKAVRNMHCHFSKIEFTEKGERRHHILGNNNYGPDFRLLSELIADYKMHPVIICETPLLDYDAMEMRDILKSTLNQ
jgi:deoxyribonuclease-4